MGAVVEYPGQPGGLDLPREWLCPVCDYHAHGSVVREGGQTLHLDCAYRAASGRALRAEQRVRELEEAQGELLGLVFPRCAACQEAIEPTDRAVPGDDHGGRLVHAECAP